jgi:RNA polymerase sigma-70 factor (ECF subfamily)
VKDSGPKRPNATKARPVLVNGEPGIVAWGANGKPLGVMACTVVNGRIVEILSIRDPQRLAAMDLPPRPE